MSSKQKAAIAALVIHCERRRVRWRLPAISAPFIVGAYVVAGFIFMPFAFFWSARDSIVRRFERQDLMELQRLLKKYPRFSAGNN